MSRSKPPRWHVSLTDYGSLAGQIEWDSRTIADAAWHIDRAWGQWGSLPGADGDVLLSDALIAHVYDRESILSESPAYVLVAHEKQRRIVRRRPEY